MMGVQLCFPVKQKCWNPEDSYMEICVGCGCCSKDAKTRALARYQTAKNHLEEKRSFNDWSDDPKWRETEEKNVKSDIRWYRKKVWYYKDRLKKLGVEYKE